MSVRPEVFLLPEDIETLQPHGELNGLVINGYLRLIERRSIYYTHLPSVWACDSSFRSDWLRGGFEATRSRVRSIELFERDVLLFPLNLPRVGPRGHWALAAVWPRHARAAYFDSMGGRGKFFLDQILDFLERYADSKGVPFDRDGWELEDTPSTCPRQMDMVSCGVFVCVFADRVARGREVCATVDVGTARRTISGVLRRGRFENEEFPETPAQQRSREVSSAVVVAQVDLCSPQPEAECPVTGNPSKEEAPVGEAVAEAVEETPAVVGLVAPVEDDGVVSELEQMETEEESVQAPPTVASPCLELEDARLEEELDSTSAAREQADARKERAHRKAYYRRLEARRQEKSERFAAVERRLREQRRARDFRHQRRGHSPAFGGEDSHRHRRSHRVRETAEERDFRRPTPRHGSPVYARLGEAERMARCSDCRRRIDAEVPRRGPHRGEERRGILERLGNRHQDPPRQPREDRIPGAPPAASPRAPFPVPQHLRQRYEELAAQGWTRQQMRNKRWWITREDGSRFRIRGVKLGRLNELH